MAQHDMLGTVSSSIFTPSSGMTSLYFDVSNNPNYKDSSGNYYNFITANSGTAQISSSLNAYNGPLILSSSNSSFVCFSASAQFSNTNKSYHIFAPNSDLVLSSSNVALSGNLILKSQYYRSYTDKTGSIANNTYAADVIYMVNNSGVTLSQGNIVVISGALGFGTTAVAQSNGAIGVVWDSSIVAGATGRIAIGGLVPVSSSAAVASGTFIVTSTTRGLATGSSNPGSGSYIGQYLSSSGIGQLVIGILY